MKGPKWALLFLTSVGPDTKLAHLCIVVRCALHSFPHEIDDRIALDPVMQAVCPLQARHSACDYLTETPRHIPRHAQVNSPRTG